MIDQPYTDLRVDAGAPVISYERLRFALMNLDGTQWRIFERLANVFLSDEFPSLRPLASTSGDDGMDACLYRDSDEEDVVLQYSVRKDWSAKIRETCRRLKETAPNTRVLIFVSNQEIGPAANAAKKAVRKDFEIYLDIRDREWLLIQRNSSAKVSAEAEEFCSAVADPHLKSEQAIERRAQALSDLETKAAFVYLGLQWQDDTRDKGLTRLCFEALVRSVLRDTTSDARMSRVSVRNQVAKLLPAHQRSVLDQQVDGALQRLAKVHIRYWRKQDEFCLTWEERVRLAGRLAEMEVLDDALRVELMSALQTTSREAGFDYSTEVIEGAASRARGILERVLLDRGELFAEAVIKETGAYVRFEDVEAVVYRDLSTTVGSLEVEPRVIAAAVQHLLVDPPEAIHRYLRSLADTYTLFSFMRETPDVQSAVVKIFSDGDIWLDTSIVLPALAETLLDEPSRSHTRLLKAARECGLNLYVTSGVIEELVTHVSRCQSFTRAVPQGNARGEAPFLLNAHTLAGRSIHDFERWLETFCGRVRPEDDMIDYLSENHGIEVLDLGREVDSAETEFKAAVSEVWHEARDARDRRAQQLGMPPMDSSVKNRLIAHDVESYVGIVVRRHRRNERRSAFGYRSWWLTLDRTAFRMPRELASRLTERPPASPAISIDFMLHYLAIGPVRARLSKRTEEALPLMMNMSVLDAVPRALLDLADELRGDLSDLPPNVVNRKIRDTLDEARVLLGPLGREGEAGLTDEVKRRLIEQARER